MKKLVLIIMFVATCMGVSYAQKAPVTAESKAEEVVAKLKTDLNLSEDQVGKVKAITVERINKVTAAVKKYSPDKNRVQAASKLVLEEWETELKGLVSDEQFSKYLATKGK
jgi:hypothetical protein